MPRKKQLKKPDNIMIGQITARAVRRKAPDGTPFYLRAADQRAYWQARLMGNSKDRPTVWRGWATVQEATEAIARLVADGLPDPETSSNRSSRRAAEVRTVADLMTAWVDHQHQRLDAGDIADQTYDRYRITSRYWVDALGEVLARRLTRSDVEDTVLAWGAGEEGLAPRTLSMTCKVVRMAVKWGAKRGHCEPIDLSGIAPTVREDEYVYCSHTPRPEEVADVLDHVSSDTHRAALHLMAVTGARVGEIAAVRVRDYDSGTGLLRITGRDTGRSRRGKSKKAREFPVPDDARHLVEREDGDPDDYLFDLPANAGPTLNAALTLACGKAESTRFSNHGLRRMVVMRMLDAGVDPKTISKLTGHSLKTLLTSYVRPTHEHLRSAVGRANLGTLRPRGQVVAFPESK